MYTNFGVYQSPPDHRDYRVENILERVELPNTVRLDHRIQKVLNQGFCGTCVGKGCNSILSAGHETDLSSLYIYSRCKELDGIPHAEGTFPRVAMKVITQEGSCLDSTLPYSEMKMCLYPPSITSRMTNEASRYRALEYARAWNLNDVKNALASGYLVGATFWVGDNWMNYTGEVMYQSFGINVMGLHWVVLCGYDDDLNSVRGVNSWGESWGDKGFFWLTYDAFINDYTEGWVVKVKQEHKPPVKLKCYQKLIAKIKKVFKQ